MRRFIARLKLFKNPGHRGKRNDIQASTDLPGPLPEAEVEGQDSIINGGVLAPIQALTAPSTDPPDPSSSPRHRGTTEVDVQRLFSIRGAIRSAHAVAIKPGIHIIESSTKRLNLWNLAVNRLEEETRKSITASVDNIDLVKTLIEEINEKKKACGAGAKRWFYTNSKGENIFYVEALVGQLNKFAQIGNVVLQHHPGIVAFVRSGFRALLQVRTVYTEDMRTVSESLEYIVQILHCCDIYESLLSEISHRTVLHLNRSIVDLYVSILEYIFYVKRYLIENTERRVPRSFCSDLKNLLDKIRVKESLVLKNVAIVEKASSKEQKKHEHETGKLKARLEEIKEPPKNIENAVEAVYIAIEKDRKLEILDWLSGIKFIDHHHFASGRRQKKTGLWLQENDTFKEWRDSESSSLLWLRGDAGYGKTTLVSYVIDELQETIKSNECVMAYFYCNYKEVDRNKPETILRTLIKQFCLKNPGDPNLVPLRISSLYEERERQGHASGGLRYQESTDLIIKLSEMYLQVFIIVDALDECCQDTRNHLFFALKSLVDAGSNIKVFVASRFEKDIEDMFADYKCHYIQASDNTKDINNYIDFQLSLRCDTRRCGAEKLLLGGNVKNTLKEEISLTLKAKANGMFMWVNLQILALCEESTPGRVRKALAKLPKDLNGTYDRIIENIEAKTNSNTIPELVLKWILCAQEPCTVQTVIQALAVGPGEDPFDEDTLSLTLSYILDYCKNLVVEDSGLGKLRFAHFSVQEYLLTNPKFNNPTENHTLLAEICAKALLNHHRGAETSHKMKALLDYATQHWVVHAHLSGSPPKTSNFYKLGMEIFTQSIAYEEWVSKAIQYHPNFKGSDGRFVSPFWVACYYKLYDFSNIVMVSGEVLNELNRDKRTPLSWAAGKGHIKVVEMLLRDSRVDINLADESGQTPLSWAAEKGRDKVVKFLLRDNHVDVNLADKSSQTPLSHAAVNGHDKVVELLLRDSRVDVNLADELGQTPLSWAVERSRDKVVELLLQDSRVDVNLQDESGRTPLSYATRCGHDKVVELLLRDSRVDANLADNSGQTPLSYAAERGHDKALELLLLDSRVNANLADESGITPLSWAVSKNHGKIVNLLSPLAPPSPSNKTTEP